MKKPTYLATAQQIGKRTGRRLRSNTALYAGLSARAASRVLGQGDGGMVGGRVARAIDPGLLRGLCEDKSVVLVTGTNGKSTTTRMTVAALETVGQVASNRGGDNMLPGTTSALMVDRNAPLAVLEVDEMYLPSVADEVNPDLFILLNLSRDQLDRVGEIGTVEKRLRQAINDHPDALVVANCDDPLIVSAAWDAPNVTWVSVGAPWTEDAATFPRGGGIVIRKDQDWFVEGGQFKRPSPTWRTDFGDPRSRSFVVESPQGNVDVTLNLPGRANKGNATLALAAAVSLGADLEEAARAVGTLTEVAGRYRTYDVAGRMTRLLLAKNPAGWQEALTAVPPGATQALIAVNGQVADGQDLSWLWDVDFEPLKQLPLNRLVASGQRATDLAVRLAFSDIEVELIPDPEEAILSMEPGPVQALVNYTAFRDLKRQLEAQEVREKRR